MPNTNHHDEFFQDIATAEVAGPQLIETDQVAILRRVVPKPQFTEYATHLISRLLEEQSSLEAFVRIRNVIEILEIACAQVKEHAIVDVHDSNCEIFGARVQLKQLPKKFEYNDRLVTQLEAKKAEIDAQLKARKKFLESITDPMKDESGEPIYPAKFLSGGVTLQVSF
ncbi:MAG: hypothetical protein KF749_02870 [Bacteroidetes bacterium]|nr:hypothetical protein [Bacteroidota bacterium]MCW5896759.1 hypothetical protein [Bacteroidota bacterium]